MLDAAEEREAILIAENNALRTRLSAAQRDQWEFQNLTIAYQNLVNDHRQCRYLRGQLDAQVMETRALEDRLDDERDKREKWERKNEKLKEEIHLMRRGSYESYRHKYEEKRTEVEVLKRRVLAQDDLIQLGETRIADKNKTILYLKNYLRDHGFRVD
jgi:hypothetical protein